MTEQPSTSDRPPWPTTAKRLLGHYRLFDLWQLVRRSPSSGRQHEFLRLTAPDWVNVVAVTERYELLLVEQFRHGTDRTTLEIPGGCVDPGESPADAARRELEEETGFRTAELIPIGVVEPNPAFLSNRCWTFLALGCRPDGDARPDPSEEITVRRTTLAEFGDLVHDGTIGHALVIAAHDHLQRGIARSSPWADRLRGGHSGRAAVEEPGPSTGSDDDPTGTTIR